MNNTNNNEDEIKIIDLQQIVSLLFVIASLISIFVTYENEQRLKNKKTFFSEDKDFKLNLFNRLFIIILLLVFFYTSYVELEIGKKKNKNLKPLKLQLLASALTLTAGFIVLYTLFISQEGSIAQFENPQI